MKKLVSVCLAALMLLSLAACGAAPSAAPAQTPDAPAQSAAPVAAALSGKVTTGGSTSMEKVIGALSEAFMLENSGVSVTYDPTGSGAGIAGATEKTLDIGLSSRNLKDTETGLDATVIALDGIAIIVNKANTVSDLTLDQIAKIAKGEITNWKDVGGADAEIVFYGREAGSGTRDGFESIVKVADACVYAEELTATGAVVGKVASNENAIGYASLASVEDTVNAIKVDGVEASVATVQDGSYKIQRPFVFVTNASVTPSDAVKAFIDFTLSADAQEILTNAGAIPLK